MSIIYVDSNRLVGAFQLGFQALFVLFIKHIQVGIPRLTREYPCAQVNYENGFWPCN